MTLIVKRPRTSQPQLAVGVDWSNPITRALEWAKIAPSALFTGAFGGQPTLGGGATPDPQTLVAGISSKYDTTNYAVLPAGIGNAAEGTVLVVHASTALPPSGGGGYSHVLASNISSSSTNGWMLMLGNGNGYLQFRTVNPAAGVADGTIALNDGRVHASIGVWRTASGAQVRSYVDGRVNGTGTNAAAGSVSQDTWVGKAQDSFWSGLQGNILFVALFRRALSDSEALALSANPWQLLLQPSRRLWVAPAVVGGGVTHATSGALTSGPATLAGTAAHIAVHGSTGALAGAGGALSGTAARLHAFSSAGVPAGGGATVTGAAARAAAGVHTASGSLAAGGAALAGTAARIAMHATAGTLAGAGATLAGTAAHVASHTTTGALVGAAAIVAGTAAHKVVHAANGILVVGGAALTGVTSRPAPASASVSSAIGGPASSLFALSRGEVQYPSTREAQASWGRFIVSVKPTRID